MHTHDDTEAAGAASGAPIPAPLVVRDARWHNVHRQLHHVWNVASGLSQGDRPDLEDITNHIVRLLRRSAPAPTMTHDTTAGEPRVKRYLVKGCFDSECACATTVIQDAYGGNGAPESWRELGQFAGLMQKNNELRAQLAAATARPTITDEMVERAAQAACAWAVENDEDGVWERWDNLDEEQRNMWREEQRTALRAALAPAARERAAHNGLALQQRVTQTRLHSESVNGNCTSACLASVFGGDIETYDARIPFTPDWWSHVEAIFREHGLLVLQLSPVDGTPAGVCFAAGVSPRGVRHLCVAQDGMIVHDPHPSRAGLTEITDYWVAIPWVFPSDSALAPAAEVDGE